jgi:hypothetical protein
MTETAPCFFLLFFCAMFSVVLPVFLLLKKIISCLHAVFMVNTILCLRTHGYFVACCVGGLHFHICPGKAFTFILSPGINSKFPSGEKFGCLPCRVLPPLQVLDCVGKEFTVWWLTACCIEGGYYETAIITLVLNLFHKTNAPVEYTC